LITFRATAALSASRKRRWASGRDTLYHSNAAKARGGAPLRRPVVRASR
jgi:hypothetical protein